MSDVRKSKGKSCVKKKHVEDKSLKTSSHQFQFVVGTKYEPKGHERFLFHTRDHQHAKHRIPDQTFKLQGNNRS